MTSRGFTLDGIRYSTEPEAEAAPRPSRDGWARGSTRRWRKFRAAVLDEEPRCVHCLQQGRLTIATELHHVMPLSRGGAEFDRENVEPLCAACHRRTMRRRRGAVGVDGMPLSPDHPWHRE